jgi:hypothetical protein
VANERRLAARNGTLLRSLLLVLVLGGGAYVLTKQVSALNADCSSLGDLRECDQLEAWLVRQFSYILVFPVVLQTLLAAAASARPGRQRTVFRWLTLLSVVSFAASFWLQASAWLRDAFWTFGIGAIVVALADATIPDVEDGTTSPASSAKGPRRCREEVSIRFLIPPHNVRALLESLNQLLAGTRTVHSIGPWRQRDLQWISIGDTAQLWVGTDPQGAGDRQGILTGRMSTEQRRSVEVVLDLVGRRQN